MRKHEIILVSRLVCSALACSAGLLLCGCECESESSSIFNEEREIKIMELELIRRQKDEFVSQMNKQEETIRKVESELAKLERANYLKSLRLELLKMKDENNQELRERLAESREEKARLESERRNLFWLKNARINQIRKTNLQAKLSTEQTSLEPDYSLREDIESLKEALLQQKLTTDRLAKEQGSIIQPTVQAEPAQVEPLAK